MANQKVKSILVAQPKPESEKSPYFDLAKKYKLKIDFRPFINVEGVSSGDFRRTRVNILDYGAVVFTSKNAVDHFFRMCAQIRITPPETMKYFCISETTAYYLQKYIQYRKRKVFHGKQTIADLMKVMKKHKQEKFLLPCTDIHKQEIPDALKQNDFKYTESIFYKTVCCDLSDLDIHYDMIVFFSPAGITSLLKNFPKFKQNSTRIAAFGPATAQAAVKAKLRLDVQAPMPNAPSMTMAIEQYLKKLGK